MSLRRINRIFFPLLKLGRITSNSVRYFISLQSNNEKQIFNLGAVGRIQFNKYCSNLVSTVSFDELKRSTNNNKVTIIDVREPKELAETGVIPNSINIPLGDVEAAFAKTNDEFKRVFGLAKPSKENEIIFTCKKGIRSEKALLIVKQFGYNNLKNYKGGWDEWEEKIKS